ncbi:MAG: hypothetical protein LBU88_03180 [Treponema sp.]|jgi:hypothetical protein|nr:hypothetical protein [Treponema sp.]
MKYFFKVFGIVAIIAIVGLLMIGCPPSDTDLGNEETTGSGKYNGKDVLGNSYSLSVGSDASRAAVKGDRYSMDVTTRDGNTKTSKGTVTGINNDGTLVLKPDNGEAFTAMADGFTLNSVAGTDGGMANITFDNNSKIRPRTFNEIHLRATRWENGLISGEHWGSGMSILVRDFPTNVYELSEEGNYSITLSGISNAALNFGAIEIQGLKNGNWNYLGGGDIASSIPANTNFERKIQIQANTWDAAIDLNLMNYDEIILQFTNVMRINDPNHPEYDKNNGTIPANIPNGQIMATIRNFKISLKDDDMEELLGNMGDYSFGYQEDGLSIEYKQAVWKLSPANIATAKQGARFEFIVLEEVFVPGEIPHARLDFIWQDPVRGLWWQDQTTISEWDETESKWVLNGDAFIWDAQNKKYSIDLSKVIKDNQFNTASELNFIIALWGYGAEPAKNVGQLRITGANLIVAPKPTAGNIGNYSYGYEEDGLTVKYSQAVWYLPEDSLAAAQTAGSKLKIVFNGDTLTDIHPHLALVYQDIDNQNWWEGQTVLCNWNVDTSQYDYHNGVGYDSAAKTLTIPLDSVFNDNYSAFQAVTEANLVLAMFYPDTNINNLQMVSVNIVPAD